MRTICIWSLRHARHDNCPLQVRHFSCPVKSVPVRYSSSRTPISSSAEQRAGQRRHKHPATKVARLSHGRFLTDVVHHSLHSGGKSVTLNLMENITPNSSKAAQPTQATTTDPVSPALPFSVAPRPRKFSTISSRLKAQHIMRCLAEHKAEDIIGLDVADKSSCMDAVVIATAKSSRHARSLADALNELSASENLEWLRMEGYQNGEWVLVDMNDVVVHLFIKETRELFQIEGLWRSAAEIDPNSLPEPTPAPLKPTLLLILDGYGLTAPGPGNAVTQANTPNLDRLLALPGRVSLTASGRAVGLPEGYMGNSEVGHLNIGAGRIVYQDMTRIDMAVESGELAQNPVLCDLLERVRTAGGRIHFAGLLSDGGVHSHIAHLEALLRIATDSGVPAVVHAFLDGRDTPPTSGARYVQQLEGCLKETGARLGSMIGRFYAMDRDKRWERVLVAWNLLVHGHGEAVNNPVTALESAYASGEVDEFLKPRLTGDPQEVTLRDGDGLFFFNFRADRARELAAAFHVEAFDGFDRGRVPQLAGIACMTSYDATLDLPVAFAKSNIEQTLGETVADSGLRQLRIAETEKYAHVTYFFSGGREQVFKGEDRILVNSPRDVATYDLKPQMSAEEVTDRLIEAWNRGIYTLVVCNLANPDMVGHTGVLPAAIAALETVDTCVERIEKAVTASGGRLILTADHGNIEAMIDPATGSPHTAHTCNPVPLLALDAGKSIPLKEGGKLGDIAPTILALWGMTPPKAMTGTSLLAENA